MLDLSRREILAGTAATYAALPAGLGSGDDGKAYWVTADNQAYIWNGAAFPAQYAGLKLGQWKVVASWDKSAGDANTNNIVGNVTGYSEALVVFSQVTLTASGWRDARVSINGGASFLGGTNYSSMDSNGELTLESALLSHSTSSASSRSGFIHIFALSETIGAKPVATPARTLPASMVLTASPITHIQAFPTSGNFSGGKIYILAR